MEASYGQTRAALRGRVQPTSTAALLPTQKSSKWVVMCHQHGANEGPNKGPNKDEPPKSACYQSVVRSAGCPLPQGSKDLGVRTATGFQLVAED